MGGFHGVEEEKEACMSADRVGVVDADKAGLMGACGREEGREEV